MVNNKMNAVVLTLAIEGILLIAWLFLIKNKPERFVQSYTISIILNIVCAGMNITELILRLF